MKYRSDRRTVWIAPDCSPEVDRIIREEATQRGDDVMPRRPFPWNRRPKSGTMRPTPGSQNKPRQLDLSGCDHEPSRLLLQRKVDAALKPDLPQRPCDVGLFSDDARQTDITDLTNGRKP